MIPEPEATEQEYQDAHWVSGIFRPLLIAFISACLLAGPLAVLRVMTPWDTGYVLPLAFVVTLEGVYTTLQRGRPKWRDRRGLLIRFAELAVILLALRLSIYAFSAGLPSPDVVANWLNHPGTFFDTQFVAVGTLLVIAWALAISTTGDFLELAIQPDEFLAHEPHAWGESDSSQRASRGISRTDIVSRFAARWTTGGIFLVASAAASRTNFALDGRGGFSFGISALGLPQDVLIALLIYFLAGFLLLSEGRLAVLRGRWFNQGINIRPGVLGRWRFNSLALILAVAVIAALLPLGSTSWLAVILNFLINILTRAAYLILFVFIFLLNALLSPLGKLFSSSQAPAQQTPPPQLELPPQAASNVHLPPWLAGALTWVAIIAVLVYLLLSYLNAHGLLAGLWRARWVRLRYWWRARWAKVRAATLAATADLRERLARMRPVRINTPHGRVVRVGALPPAARIRYFYLSTLARAAREGVARQPHETPLEFGRDLTTQWPDSEVDFDVLTEAFLAARYDRRPIHTQQARETQSVWRRVMHKLRRPAGIGAAQDATTGRTTESGTATGGRGDREDQTTKE
jgi:hypothetical protein